MRGVVVLGALLLALGAFYVLLRGGSASNPKHALEATGPALDDIDAKSRAAMRELLREAGEEE
ncbi:MAG: hypothetical protein CL908_08005 [Deltaproteobacteria bacterium]|nr:hypothetical protein [Deltaproteobacteria bacterium]